MNRRLRKEQIRAYREAPKAMGVFRVHCRQTGRGVIGWSRDLPSMLNRQRAQLSMGAHPDRALQADWEALGAEAFVFEVLDTLPPKDDPGYDPADDLGELARMWQERLTAG
jgi:hypothetical protein